MGDLDARLQFSRQRFRKYDDVMKGVYDTETKASESWPSGFGEGTTGSKDVIQGVPFTVQQQKGGEKRNSSSSTPSLVTTCDVDCNQGEQRNGKRGNEENEVALLGEELQRMRACREAVSLRRRYIGRKRAEILQCQYEVSSYSLVIASAIGSLKERAESLETRKILASERLEELMSTNVGNDAFHIWFSSGNIVTINGFRVGRPSSSVVPWLEVNAGLGQAALALHTVAASLGVVFTRFAPAPIGSFSKMVSQLDDDKKTSKCIMHNLFSYNSFSIFPHRSLNRALKAFLCCLSDVERHVIKLDPILQLPHGINDERGTVGGMSVSLTQWGGGDEWCRAMKFALTNLKWLLAATAKYGHDRRPRLPEK